MRRVSILAFVAIAAFAQADVTYKVVVQPDQENLHVTMHLPNTQKGSRLQMPNWAPGAYFVRDGSTSVKNLRASDGSGTPLKVDLVTETIPKPYVNGTERLVADNKLGTWIIAPARETTIEYDIPSRPIDGAMHWSGPGTYLYETSRKTEKCALELQLPSGWSAYLGLDPVRNRPNAWTAKDYDVLADNPVTAGGDLIVDKYESRGKTHWIVMRGKAKSKVDRAYLIKACKFVSDTQTDFFGGRAPYNLYVWHFSINDAPDGAGGLEHLSSTQISLASGVGPRAVGVIAHEFFHLWNVKRIRSRALGPFDYTKLPETGALWWLEGVTDYFAHTLLYRYGWSDRATYYGNLLSNVQNVRTNPAHDQISPFESSMRVGEASNGRGNSGGYLISYYNQGWVAGMVLDIELISRTGGKYSLSDVERALWELCRDDKPGFEEGEIRRQLVRFGGAGMGEFYDQVIGHAGEMAIDETLAKAGLRLANTPESFVDLGFTWSSPPQAGRVMVGDPRATGLRAGDVIVGVNGVTLAGTNGRELSGSMAAAVRDAAVGKPIKLSISRADQPLEITVIPTAGSRPSFKVLEIPYATSEQKAVRAKWLSKN